MKPPARWHYRLAALGLVLLAALLGLRQYLAAGGATVRLARGLTEKLGAPVTVGDSRVSLTGDTALTDLKLYEPDGDEPFFEAQRIVVDVNALRYATGRGQPREVDVEGAHLRLRFDAAGQLLTRLGHMKSRGGAWPVLRLRDSQLTIEQEGRSPFTVHGVDLTLDPAGERNLTGKALDPAWQTLEVSGHLDPNTLALSLAVSSTGATLDMTKLRALPFVPAALWNQLELQGGAVPLRFTLNTSTTAPRVRYAVEFEGVGVRLPQPDRPAFVAGPARGKLEGNEDGFSLSASIADAAYGNWTVAGSLDAKTGGLGLTLTTPDVLVTPAKLEALPYVPKVVWKQVRRVNGRTAAKVSVGLNTKRPGVTYRVELDVPRTQIEVTSIGLDAQNASGRVIVEDGRVWLEKVQAEAAQGRIFTTAEMDFRQEPSRMHFRVRAAGLVLAKLPKTWELPKQVEGKLTGEADLTVTVRDQAETRGRGTGQIDDAKVLGFRTSEPILLTLQADGQGLRFRTPSPILNTLIAVSRLPAAPPPKKPSLDLGRLASQVKAGVGQATHQIARGAASVLSGLGSYGRSLKPDQPTSYLDARIALNNVDLAELVRRAGVELPRELALAGKLSLKVDLGIPINKATDYRIYRIDGTATSPRLSLAGVDFQDLTAQVSYRDGVLRLQRLAGQVAGGGTFAGQASAAVFPRGDLSASLELRRLPLEALARLVPGGRGVLAGSLSGKVTASAPLKGLGDPKTWRGAGSLKGSTVELLGLPLRDVAADLTLGGGKLAVTDLRGELSWAPLRGSASLSLVGKQPVTAHVSLRGVDLAVARPLLPPAWQFLRPSGRLDLTGDLDGTLEPRVLNARGRLTGTGLVAAGVRVGAVALDLALVGQVLQIKGFQAKLYRGSITGSASLPLVERKPITVNLTVKDVDARALAKAVGGLPVQVAGPLSGQANLTLQPAAKISDWRGEVSVSSPRLIVQNIPATGVKGQVKWRGGEADYRLDGNTLGGSFSVQGKYPPPPRRPVGSSDGRIQLRGIRLSRLSAVLGLPEGYRVRGVASLDLPFRHEGPGGRPVGTGTFSLRDIRLGAADLADEISGTVRLDAGGLSVSDLAADLAGGILRLVLNYRFGDPERSRFRLTLSRADASRLAGFDTDLRDRFSGPVDVMLHGSLGQEWRGGGMIVLSHGKVMGVEVSEWRLPIDFTLAPAQQRLELSVRDSGAQLGAGRAQLNLHFLWSGTGRLDGRLLFFDASLRSLAGLTGDISSYASGRVTGRADLGGSEIRSLNDVTANVQARLRDTQALQLPGFSVLTPYILPGLGGTTFNTGDLRGRLGGGVFRIDSLNLEAPVAHLFVQGSVTLATRLDLEVIARTGNLGGVNPLLARILLNRIPIAGPVPVGLILQATNLFSNRVVNLHVTGTIRNPVVQVKPLQLLSDEAVRYFLNRAIAAPGAASFP